MKMKNSKCSWSTILSLVSMIIVVVLVIFIAVTYLKQLQCRDDDDNSTESSKLMSFLLFSDVHLDPFYKYGAAAGKNSFCRNESKPSTYNATYGRIGCDSPLELLHQLLNAMKQKASSLSNLDFLMLSGMYKMNFYHKSEGPLGVVHVPGLCTLQNCRFVPSASCLLAKFTFK